MSMIGSHHVRSRLAVVGVLLSATLSLLAAAPVAGAFDVERKLTASDGTVFDRFGSSVALSGDTAVVGAYSHKHGRGAAYVITRSGATWSEQAKLTAADGVTGFGASVAASGDTAVVGAGGAAYVFTRSGTTWTQEAKLTAADGVDGDLFGTSVAVSGDTAVVGAFGADGQRGAAYVFTRSGPTWTQEAKLTAADGVGWDLFGRSVALSGDTAVVGAEEKDSSRGAAYIFARSGATWSEQARLTADEVGGRFGTSVAAFGDTAAVGAPSENGVRGAAYVFTRTGGTWSEQAKLTAADGVVGESFGSSLALSGDTAVVGTPHDDSSRGAAYVFTRSGATWSEQAKLTASDSERGDIYFFGRSVALSGDTPLIGADGIGAAYSYGPGRPEYTRTPLSLSYSAKKDKFKGRLTSPEPSCVAAQSSPYHGGGTIYKEKRGRDRRLDTFLFDAKGRYSTTILNAKGRFYSAVGQTSTMNATCRATKSKAVKVG